MSEHLGISALTGKRVKGDDDSAIKEHLLFCNHASDYKDFSILATNDNYFKFTSMQSLLMDRDDLPLNKSKQSRSLEVSKQRNKGTKFRHMVSCEIDSFCCSSFILKVVL